MKCNPWVGGSIGRRGFPMLGTGKRGLSTYIKELFANNEQGFFYDPNDLSTMFQDAAGTVPVTGAGQPVGLILDKSKGVVLSNEKVVNPDFVSDTAWTKAPTVTISGGSAIMSGASGNPVLSQYVALVPNAWYDVTIVISEVSSGSAVFRCYGTGGNDGVLGIPSAGTYKFKMKARSDATGLIGFSASSTSLKIDSVSVKEIAGNHAYQTASASRPILRQNASTGAYYLEFDGSDDFLQTSNIDFTATDKVSLFTGVRKLADTTQIIAELSVSAVANNNSFYFIAGTDAGPIGYSTTGRGAIGVNGTQTARNITYLAPDTAVLSTKHNISGNLSSIRRNGVVGVDGTGYKGTGNFGNYPLYICRRGGVTNALNGHIYSLIGVGRLTTESEIAAIEKELAKRTGVTLSV